MQLFVTDHLFERLVKYRKETLNVHKNLTSFELNDNIVFLIDNIEAIYWLSKNGSIYLQDQNDIRPTQASEYETFAAIVIAAQTLNMPQLLDILPHSPQDAIQCPVCRGSRWFIPPTMQQQVVCNVCRGRGWATEKMLQPAITNGFIRIINTEGKIDYVLVDC